MDKHCPGARSVCLGALQTRNTHVSNRMHVPVTALEAPLHKQCLAHRELCVQSVSPPPRRQSGPAQGKPEMCVREACREAAGEESALTRSLTHRAWALSSAGRRCVSFCPPVAMVSVTLFITASVGCMHGRETLSCSGKEVGQTGGPASGWAGWAGSLPVCPPVSRVASPVPSTPQKWSYLHAAPRPLHPPPHNCVSPCLAW